MKHSHSDYKQIPYTKHFKRQKQPFADDLKIDNVRFPLIAKRCAGDEVETFQTLALKFLLCVLQKVFRVYIFPNFVLM